MIDCDTCIIKDFYGVIDRTFDIQFTTMASGRQINRAGIPIKEIACFTVFNNIPKSILFVGDWIAKIDELSKKVVPPYETPAMNMTIAENCHGLSFGYLQEHEICADMAICPDTRILHLKSNGGTGADPVQNFFGRAGIVNYRDYIDREELDRWSASYGK
jgi:hypothetical protein